LQAYHAEHGRYPVSQGMQGYASAWGASLGAHWIPELTLEPFPRDPAVSETGNEAQYLYSSDGADYKVIAHATGDCGPHVERDGVRIDPRRLSETSCWGYGFWSEGGEGL
jgi:hypothetical protein